MTEDRLAEDLGDRLRLARLKARLNQAECGRLSGVHRSQISLIENGRRLPRLDAFMKLAGACDVPPGDLLEGIRWVPGFVGPGHFEGDR